MKKELDTFSLDFTVELLDYPKMNTFPSRKGKPEMFRFNGGYYSFDDKGNMDGCHFYVQDYQGNNRMVVNAYTDEVEQISHYYPYGALMGDISTQPEKQSFKYSGKELDCQFGLDLYDFHARQYDPLLPGFNGVDKKSEEFYWVSPYVYCLGNPVNCVDKDGQKVYYAPGTSESFKAQFANLVQYMNKCGTAGDLAKLQDSKETYYIKECASIMDNSFDHKDGVYTINLNLNELALLKGSKNDTEGTLVSPATAAAHEFGHGAQYDKMLKGKAVYETDPKKGKDPTGQFPNKEERRNTLEVESKAAKKHGEIPKGAKFTRVEYGIIEPRKTTNTNDFKAMSKECLEYNLKHRKNIP